MNLGTNRVIESAGHTYQVLVQVDWRTGKASIANVTPERSQVNRADA